jgi:sterol desaturase/sphingolipid hydroxylase (fatty acid hydroxylase superfamily)
MDLVPYAIPFFLLAIGLELVWDRYRGTHYYRGNDAINSLSLGVLSTTSKLVLVDIAGRVYGWVQSDLAIVPWGLEGWLSLAVAFVAYYFCYYWFHRISHERRIFWAAHVAHHQSEEYNLSTALRQTSTGFLLGWLFYLPLFLLGMPAEVFVTVASANLIYQFWVHTRFVGTLGPLEYVLVTPMNHRVHHARNPEYIDRNYGGFFILWDRMFGTYRAEDPARAVDYGITRGLNSWNPLWANLHVYAGMLRDSLDTPRLADKLRVWYGRTSWVAPGVSKDPATPGNHYDPAVGRGIMAYATVQFALMVLLGLAMTYLAPRLGTFELALLFSYLLASLVLLGWLLDAADPRWEWLRLGLGLLPIALLPMPDGLRLPLLAVITCSALAYWRVRRLNRPAPADSIQSDPARTA